MSSTTSTPQETILTIFGRPVNLNTDEYLTDRATLSVFEDPESGILHIGDDSFYFPDELLPGGNYSSNFTGGATKLINTDSEAKTTFYSYGKVRDVAGSISAQALTFSGSIQSDFNVAENEWNRSYFAYQNFIVSTYRWTLDVIGYLKAKYGSNVDGLWNTPLFQAIANTSPTDFFNQHGTHLVTGFGLGAENSLFVAETNSFSSQSNTLKSDVSGQRKGLFSGSFSLSVFTSELSKQGFEGYKVKLYGRGQLGGTFDQPTVESLGLISYNGKFITIADLIAPFDRDGLEAAYRSAYESYQQAYAYQPPIEPVTTVATLSFDGRASVEVKVGTTTFTSKEMKPLTGISFKDYSDKSYLLTIEDKNGFQIRVSGDSVVEEYAGPLTTINTSLARKPASGTYAQLDVVQKITVEPITHDNAVYVAFHNENYDYSNKWVAFSANDGSTNSLITPGLNGNTKSLYVPKNYEVRVYEGSAKQQSKMWSNVAGSNTVSDDDPGVYVSVLCGDNDAGALRCFDRSNYPLVTLFSSYGFYVNGHKNGYFALPPHNYKHLDNDYLHDSGLLNSFFGDDLDITTFNFIHDSSKSRIGSLIIPPGVFANCRVLTQNEICSGKNALNIGPNDHVTRSDLQYPQDSKSSKACFLNNITAITFRQES